MPPTSFVFDEEHGGQKLDLSAEPREPDYAAVEREERGKEYTEERVRSVAAYCRRVRDSSDRAVFFNGLPGTLGFPGGMAEFSMVCLLHPEWVRELHRIRIEGAIRQAELLLPEIRDCVDVLIIVADDQGTQNGPILPPAVFHDLYVPYYRRLTDAVHRIAPDAKLFLHSCGAIYDLIPQIIEAGFDILNPVQWPAGGHGPAEWKAACRGKLSLWGGGINTQRTLPLGTVEEVAEETRRTVPVLARGGGYVFAAIHNILAEIDPRKVIAMYRAAVGEA
jgi:uroporphyrinogen decarboxylase